MPALLLLAAAVRLLGGIGITPAAIGNMWWLSSDPALANFKTGLGKGAGTCLRSKRREKPL